MSKDRRGKPFVGPAGAPLHHAPPQPRGDRGRPDLTHAVQHFRWKPAERGKRRIHQKPATRHVNACRPWLSAELSLIRPDVVIALGAVAASTLFGPSFALTRHRGQPLAWPPPDGPFAAHPGFAGTAFATVHPSAVLRAGPNRKG